MRALAKIFEGKKIRQSLTKSHLFALEFFCHLLFLLLSLAWISAAAAAPKPNVIFILADDLGYGELGCYGQKVIQTPRLDRMAAEGLRFTQFYAGTTVCAPSRCVLMTGKHTGHCSVRGNRAGPAQALRAEDSTVAQVFKQAGYKTALIGKWGLGDMTEGSEVGLPTRKGFDYFFGYLNQIHAHNYYPEFLWRNEEKVPLSNVVQKAERESNDFVGGVATTRLQYSHDLFAAEALQWIRQQASDPFFLYLSLTLPHANNEGSKMTGDGAEVPDYGPYTNNDWPNQDKGQAAMITRLDGDVGRLLDLLKELGLAENTLVIFSSDNGAHNEARHDIKRFNPSGPLRGIKRALYEGGIRVPTLAWWPGQIAKGTVADHIGYFGDFYATVCELTEQPIPEGLDSLSFLPALRGGKPTEHPYLYWEFHEQGSRQAVRFGSWKAIRAPMFSGKVELYDLSKDLAEEHDLAASHGEVVERAVGYMETAHTPDPRWRVK